MNSSPNITATVDRLYRKEAGRLQAYLLTVVSGDFQLAEDVLHDSVAKAIERWPLTGVPEKPLGWLATVARNFAITQLRRRASFSQKIEELKASPLQEHEVQPVEFEAMPDERLRLIFTCCHPALALEAQVALTLRMVCGLSTNQIAAAFLTPVTTMAQRLVRVKRKIKEAGIPYTVPEENQLAERLNSALRVLYLVFNAGYEAERGESPADISLTEEGINLARMLDALLPDSPEVIGLLALMLLHASRRSARIDADGNLVTLENQNRALWNRDFISEGLPLVEKALRFGKTGEYQLQAAIAAIHAESRSPEKTDWKQIAILYELLLGINPSPTVALNHAAAVGMAESPEAGLKLLDRIKTSDALKNYHLLLAAYADLQRRSGQFEKAIENYRSAMKLTDKRSEQSYYLSRIRELSEKSIDI